MRMLSNKGKLLRLYTQNVDGLEERAGIETAVLAGQSNATRSEVSSASSSSSSTSQDLGEDNAEYGIAKGKSTTKSKGKGRSSKYTGELVHLHGRAELVRCTVCNYNGEWTDEISQAYEGGFSMQCHECAGRLSIRKAMGKRINVAVGTLRPAITLYGEQGLEDLFISEISNVDVRSKPDCLIVFGTSLKVSSCHNTMRMYTRRPVWLGIL